jgi:hypothetical protein
MLVKGAIGIDIKNPSVIVKCCSKLADIIFVESVNVKANDANYGVVVVCSCGHGDSSS